jgi:hypothetical protein
MIAIGALLLTPLVVFVGVRVWTATQSPEIRYVRIDPRPLTTATTVVLPTDEFTADQPGDEPESTGAQPELAVLPILPTYTVEAGDTLIQVAARFGTTASALQVINDLDNPNLVRTGQVLIVPPAQSTLQPADPAQTIRDLAILYELDVAVLAAYNGLAPERSNDPLGRAAVFVPAGPSSPLPNAPSDGPGG